MAGSRRTHRTRSRTRTVPTPARNAQNYEPTAPSAAAKPTATLTPAQQKRVENVVELAVDMMKGHRRAANYWLHRRTGMLDGDTPLEHAARSKKCEKEVEAMISRVSHGVFP